MSNLHRDDILKLARLARLHLTDSEVETFKTEINSILSYVEMLQKADTKGLEPTYQVTGLVNVTRPDIEVDYGPTPAGLLQNVPQRKDNYIKTKRILGEK